MSSPARLRATSGVAKLRNLLSETTDAPELSLFGPRPDGEAEDFFGRETFERLPERARKAAIDALDLFRFFERKKDAPDFAPVFSALLGPFDDACKAVVINRLLEHMPSSPREQRGWFDPWMGEVSDRSVKHYGNMARNLKKALVYGNPHSVIGLLRSCLDHALNDRTRIDGVFEAVKAAFRFEGARALLDRVAAVNDFRNTRIAHREEELRDAALASVNLKAWIETLAHIVSVVDRSSAN